MLASFFFVLLFFYVFFVSSMQVILVLLVIEMSILVSVGFLLSTSFSWFTFIMFLLIGVCLGAYGVSLMISLSRAKSFLYFSSL